jgi:hypothetical protein
VPDWITKLLEQRAVVAQAPIPFATVVLAAAVIIWVAVSWSYSSILASKNSQIELQDRQLADYRDKLKVGSPDEAARKIAALERQLPRHLTTAQTNTIRGTIKQSPDNPWVLIIYYHRACHDCADYGRQLKEAMQIEPSWSIGLSDFMGGETEGKNGLFIGTDDLNNPTQAARMLATTLTAANLPFSLIRSIFHRETPPNRADLYVLPSH